MPQQLDVRHDFADALPELARPATAARAPAPRALALNEELAAELGIAVDGLRTARGLRLLTGEEPPEGAHPVAQVYAGHQWGVFKPLLGDGRAMLLGELPTADGELRDLHLKGVGPTPMSRIDGFAAIGPMLREFLMGEAMHALGVPTTRALAVVETGARHRREDGQRSTGSSSTGSSSTGSSSTEFSSTEFRGAVLSRVARSHLRIGTFEYARATGDPELLRRLTAHAIVRLLPKAVLPEAAPAIADAGPARALFRSVVDAHARLTSDWVRLGFVHGVLSTDNVTISGETIDFGPCAFIDRYDPGIWFSSIDELGRYAYDRQAPVMAWNLARLGDALEPLLGSTPTAAQEFVAGELERFTAGFERHRIAAFRAKLGLGPAVPDDSVGRLTDAALGLLERHAIDFTGFFRALAPAAEGDDSRVRELFDARSTGTESSRTGATHPEPAPSEHVPGIEAWLVRWRALAPDADLIRSANPVYIPRNHLLDEALERAGNGDLTPFRALLGLVSDPFREHAGTAPEYSLPAPRDAAQHVTFCGT